MARPSLQQYRTKRHFRHTPEPKGGALLSFAGGHFVVQKHAARRLHYDLRLELGGILKSWAVPKGPSLNPHERRLAVQVEDHPLEYARFEGVIPKNQYGAGTVMIWDEGEWSSDDTDPLTAYDKGHLHFTLNGLKLKGRWSLVRMHSKDREEKNWLLIKQEDAYASGFSADDLDEHSAVTHRTLEQITLGVDATRDARQKRAPHRGHKGPQPDFIHPQLATLVDTPPSGDHWLHEIKYDGYRILARVSHQGVTLFSRAGKDWTHLFPTIRSAIISIGLSSAWLDGELCFVKADGTTSFQSLQNAIKAGNASALVYFVFDLLYLNGNDLSKLPLSERKQLLAGVLGRTTETSLLHFADHLQGQGTALYEQACQHRLEGILSKRADRPHRAGRGREWLKIKCLQRQEFVIGGFTRSRHTHSGFGALLLGVYENNQLIYTGKVGTGFSEQLLKTLYAELDHLRANHSEYQKGPPKEVARTAIWVQPKLVAEIEFSNWTRDGYLRQPSFKGLREDKKPTEIVREQTHPLEKSPLEQSHRVHIPTITRVSLSNPNKALYPPEGITKQALAHYYEEVAEWMLPYVTDRPLTLLRCPNGYTKECFFQKHDVTTTPAPLKRVTVLERNQPMQYLTIYSVEGLISLVQMGVLEIHTWGARADRPERPDQLVFDIDPQEQLPWKRVVSCVQTLHTLLGELDLQSFAKATGGKGIHVVVPIARRHTWQEIKSFTKAVASILVQFDPSLYTASITKHSRQGKVFIDYVRNTAGATTIAPYSTRARPNAPVAVPLAWNEVDEGISPNHFNFNNIRERLRQLKKDPWENFFSVHQTITKSMLKKVGL